MGSVARVYGAELGAYESCGFDVRGAVGPSGVVPCSLRGAV